MKISEYALRDFIREVLLEKRIRIVNKNNIEEKMNFLKDYYRGHFNWQLNSNRYNFNENVLNYSVIMTESLVEVLFHNSSGVVLDPPESFDDSEFNPDFKISSDRFPERKYYMDFKRTRWGRGDLKLDIDRVQTNLRNEDPKWGSFKFSEDMSDLGRVNSGKSSEAFLEFINTIFLLTDRKIKKGKRRNLTIGSEPLRISGQIFADDN